MAKTKKRKGKKGSKGNSANARETLKALTQNPLVADVVAAALVATASALKDSRRARALADEAGDELVKLTEAGAERGSAMWDLALEIGRRSLEALAGDNRQTDGKRSKKDPLATKGAGKTGKKKAAASRASNS